MVGKSQDGIREQTLRFEQAARELECDESEEHFDAALKKVAAHKPAGDPAPPKKPATKRSAK
jgi:hypothetical protein